MQRWLQVSSTDHRRIKEALLIFTDGGISGWPTDLLSSRNVAGQEHATRVHEEFIALLPLTTVPQVGVRRLRVTL